MKVHFKAFGREVVSPEGDISGIPAAFSAKQAPVFLFGCVPPSCLTARMSRSSRISELWTERVCRFSQLRTCGIEETEYTFPFITVVILSNNLITNVYELG